MLCLVCNAEIDLDPANFVLLHLKPCHDMDSKAYYDAFFRKDGEGVCANESCSNETKFKALSVGYSKFCCRRCVDTSVDIRKRRASTFKETYKDNKDIILTKRRQTRKEKYDDENFGLFGSSGFRANLKRKYGDEHYNNTEKRKKTCVEKYGVETPYLYGSTEFKQNMFEKYGAAFYIERYDRILNTLRQNRKESFLREIEKLHWELLNDVENFAFDRSFDFRCSLCGRIQKNVRCASVHLLSCPCRNFRSKHEIEVLYFLESLGVDNIMCNKQFTVNGIRKEIDLYLPDYNLGIEINGLYWHCEDSPNGTTKVYHLNKLLFFDKLNIQLIQIFENEWIHKQEIVKSIIRNRLSLSARRLFARRCELRKVSTKDAKEFFERTHIQGYAKAEIKVGLYFDGDLISCMSAGKSRFRTGEYELIRFSNELNHSIVGGFSRLLKFLRSVSGVSNIISYCDRRYFTGTGYLSSGFEITGTSPPNYFYWDKKAYALYPRQMFQKHKLSSKLSKFDPRLTEWENMQVNGYTRIWDCGNIKLKYRGE